MKFTVTMKDPDTLQDSIRDATIREVKAMGLTDPEEIEALVELRAEKVGNTCSKWFPDGEYLSVEIDTEAGTCVVVPR